MKRILSLILLLSFFMLTACSQNDNTYNITSHTTSLDECKISENRHSRYFTDKTEDILDIEEIQKNFDRYYGLVEISDEIDSKSICANFDVYDYSDFTLELLTIVCKVSDFPKYCVYSMATVKAEKKLDNFEISHLPQGVDTQLVEFSPNPNMNMATLDTYIGPLSISDKVVSTTKEVKDDPNSICWQYKWENSSEDEYYWENKTGVVENAPEWTFITLSVYAEEGDSLVCNTKTSFTMDNTQHEFAVDFTYLKDEQDCLLTIR